MQKLKLFWAKVKLNRAVYITALTLIVSLAVIVAITVAANRSKKDPDGGGTKPPVSTTTPKQDNITLPPAPDTDAPDTKPIPDKPSTDSPVAAEPPALSLPVSGTLSEFHDESLQVWSDTMRDFRVHLGVDIATEEGAPVYAAADGVVAQVWEDVKMGYCMSVKHSGNTYTIYKNLAETPAAGIEAGVSVKAGQLIANVGNSAMVEVAEEPHLHFEMTVDDVNVDPLDYFNPSAIASLGIDTKYES